jgi:hypothetical protein
MLEYVINRKDRTVIYAGRAYRRPGASVLSINISKICQDYIKDSFSETDFRNLVGSTYVHPDSYVEFELRDMNGNLLNTYGFVYDWSYETWDKNPRTVSNPINNHKMAGMYDFITNCRNVVADNTMELATSVYQVAGGNACGEIALYYKNRKGGWDSFLIEGTVTKKDEYTKYTYNRSFNNNTLEFENGTYHSQIVTSYILNTGWLSDQESDNLAFNLLSSNEVYLHNLCTDKVYPVVITDNTATYKTYKNNSRKLVNYQINVEESQRKEVL